MNTPSLSRRRTPESAAFSMLEIMLVIGIVGVLIAAGTVGYVNQMNRSRVDSSAQILNAHFQQARQMAVAMRQNRRVVIDAGALDGFPDEARGLRTRRAALWIEGKRCEEYPFESKAYCMGTGGQGKGDEPNAFAITDTEYLPDGVMIADVDGYIPGLENNPEVFYIEFNPRGAVSKVYFKGYEVPTLAYQIGAVIHLMRDNETIVVDGNPKPLTNQTLDAIKKNAKDYMFSKVDTDLEDGERLPSMERYKVQTVEVVRLTGKTRMYDFGILDPWPTDEPVQAN